MNILYIGQLNLGGTCFDRMQALSRLGHDLTGFDVNPYKSENRALRSLQYRYSPRFLIAKLNQDLLAAIPAKGYDCVWVDKGMWIFPESIAEMKRRCGLVVHFTPDSQIRINRSSSFLSSIPLYDALITTKHFEVEAYKELNAKKVVLVTQSYCPIRYKAPRLDQRFVCDVGFVGRCEHHYRECTNSLVDHGLYVRAWGPDWPKFSARRKVRAEVGGDGLWGNDYVSALASFRIGLGLLTKLIPETHTTRSFEIPAAGGFLLAERTPELMELFREGVEAEFFSSSEEMVSKAKFYARHSEARERIAIKGRERCISSGYDIDNVMHRALQEAGI